MLRCFIFLIGINEWFLTKFKTHSGSMLAYCRKDQPIDFWIKNSLDVYENKMMVNKLHHQSAFCSPTGTKCINADSKKGKNPSIINPLGLLLWKVWKYVPKKYCHPPVDSPVLPCLPWFVHPQKIKIVIILTILAKINSNC